MIIYFIDIINSLPFCGSNSFSGVRLISGGVLSRLFPGRARRQAAARGRGAPSPRHPLLDFMAPRKKNCLRILCIYCLDE